VGVTDAAAAAEVSIAARPVGTLEKRAANKKAAKHDTTLNFGENNTQVEMHPPQ
jgi:hypothetical protein